MGHKGGSRPGMKGTRKRSLNNNAADSDAEQMPRVSSLLAASSMTSGTVDAALGVGERPGPTAWDERGNMVLLVLLYMIQGVPLGLTTGALPFMLQARLSYTQMGIFSIAAYPYSLKLLWSPIVDSVYSPRIGRRKSWIIPIQLITAWLLMGCSGWAQRMFDAADVNGLTSLCFVFVFLMATQDIAVDGWALTLLSAQNVSYASTCQTLGQTTGIFTSFTVFLAMQDAGFCNKYIRSHLSLAPSDQGLVSLAGYLYFWGWVFALFTVYIAFFKAECSSTSAAHPRDPLCLTEAERALLLDRQAPILDQPSRANGFSSLLSNATISNKAGWGTGLKAGLSELGTAYVQLWHVIKLPAVWQLTGLLLTYRLGILAAEGAASLKLIDKGVAKETLAFLVLFQFPVELISALVAGRWAATYSPYPPFIVGYCLRLLTATALVALTAVFPANAHSLTDDAYHFGLLAAVSLLTSFVSYLSFTSLGSFFNTISDPAMGGAYLTLLNTISNIGYIVPRTPVFYLLDWLTVSQCVGPKGEVMHLICPKKVKDMTGESECTLQGGVCGLVSDGYYVVSYASLGLGVVLAFVYLMWVPALMALPLHKWRAQGGRTMDSKRSL